MGSNQFNLNERGIYVPLEPVSHRNDEYEEEGFETLRDMQQRHFWYVGRHRFLLGALDRYFPKATTDLSVIDLGGGAGGWVSYLSQKRSGFLKRLALADSSLVALAHAESVLPLGAERFQVDLMNLHMHQEWDAAFLLDVIEHLPNDLSALEQAQKALRPGGILFVTVPAFQQFWSYSDDVVHHLRRYQKADLRRLAKESGLTLLDTRYFMFFLSPFYLLSRYKPGIAKLSDAEKKELVHKQHQVPSIALNSVLSAIFKAETPIGHRLQFPWGTSLLGVFQK